MPKIEIKKNCCCSPYNNGLNLMPKLGLKKSSNCSIDDLKYLKKFFAKNFGRKPLKYREWTKNLLHSPLRREHVKKTAGRVP